MKVLAAGCTHELNINSPVGLLPWPLLRLAVDDGDLKNWFIQTKGKKKLAPSADSPRPGASGSHVVRLIVAGILVCNFLFIFFFCSYFRQCTFLGPIERIVGIWKWGMLLPVGFFVCFMKNDFVFFCNFVVKHNRCGIKRRNQGNGPDAS